MAGLYDASEIAPPWAAGPQAPSAVPAPSHPIDYGYDRAGNSFSRGLQSAVTSTKAGLQGVGSLAAEILGADDTANRWAQYAYANQQLAAQQAPEIHSLEQIANADNPLAATGSFVAGAAGSTLPFLALGGVGGMGARGLALAGGLRAGLSREALAAALDGAAHRGAMTAFVPQMVGEQNISLRNDPAAADMGVGERAVRSLGAGALAAYAGAKIPEAAFGVPKAQPFLATMAHQAGAGAAGMAGMDAVNQVHRMTYDPNAQFDPMQTLDAAATGAAGMAPVAIPHAALGGAAAAAPDAARAVGRGALGAGKSMFETAKGIGETAGSAIRDYGVDKFKQAVEAADTYASENERFGGAYRALKEIGGDALDKAKDSYKTVEEFAKDLTGYAGDIGKIAYDEFMDTYHDATDAGLSPTQAAAAASGAAARVMRDGVGGAKDVLDAMRGKVQATPADTLSEVVAKNGDVESAMAADLENRSGTLEDVGNVAEAAAGDPKVILKGGQATADNLALIAEASKSGSVVNWMNSKLQRLLQSGKTTGDVKQLLQPLAETLSSENFSQLPAEQRQLVFGKIAAIAQSDRALSSIEALLAKTKVEPITEGDDKGGIALYSRSDKKGSYAKAIREALDRASISPAVIEGVARTLNIKTLDEKGVDLAVRDALNKTFKRFGVDPKADESYTKAYDQLVPMLQDMYGKASDAPKYSKGMALPEGFEKTISTAVGHMINASGMAEVMGPERLRRMVAGIKELVVGASTGDVAASTVREFRRTMEHQFGDAGKAAIDEIMGAAESALGGRARVSHLGELLGDGKAREVAADRLRAATGIELSRGDLNAIEKSIERADKFDEMRASLSDKIKSLRRTIDRNQYDEDFLDYLSDELLTVRIQIENEQSQRYVDTRPAQQELAKLERQYEAEFEKMNRAYIARERLKALKAQENEFRGTNGELALMEKLITDGYATEANIDEVMKAAQAYVRAKARDLHAGENRTMEVRNPDEANDPRDTDINDYEYLQQEGTRIDPEGRGADDEVAEKRGRDLYGQDVGVEKTQPPVFAGANAFGEGDYTERKISAPINRFKDSNRNGAPSSEYTRAVDEAHTKYPHILSQGRSVSVNEWAAEMASLTGKSESELKAIALERLLEHHETKRDEASPDESAFIDGVRGFVERRGGVENAADEFFDSPIARNLKYYRLEQRDGDPMAYNAVALTRKYSPVSRWDLTADKSEGIYINNQIERDGGVFDADVYRKSLINVRIHGKSVRLDLARMVGDALRHHARESKGAETEAEEGGNIARDVGAAVSQVLSTLLNTRGVEGIESLVEGQGPKQTPGKKGSSMQAEGYLPPDTVVLRVAEGEAVPNANEEGMDSHATTRVLRMRDVSSVDRISDSGNTTFHGVKKYSTGAARSRTRGELDPATVFPVTLGSREKNAAILGKKGVAVAAAELDGKTRNVDLHAMLSDMLTRNGHDPAAEFAKNVPEDYAVTLLADAFADVKDRADIIAQMKGMQEEQGHLQRAASTDAARLDHKRKSERVLARIRELQKTTVTGDIFTDPTNTAFDNVVVYNKQYGDETIPVRFKDLRNRIFSRMAGATPEDRAASSSRDLEGSRVADAKKRVTDIMRRMEKTDTSDAAEKNITRALSTGPVDRMYELTHQLERAVNDVGLLEGWADPDKPRVSTRAIATEKGLQADGDITEYNPQNQIRGGEGTHVTSDGRYLTTNDEMLSFAEGATRRKGTLFDTSHGTSKELEEARNGTPQGQLLSERRLEGRGIEPELAKPTEPYDHIQGLHDKMAAQYADNPAALAEFERLWGTSAGELDAARNDASSTRVASEGGSMFDASQLTPVDKQRLPYRPEEGSVRGDTTMSSEVLDTNRRNIDAAIGQNTQRREADIAQAKEWVRRNPLDEAAEELVNKEASGLGLRRAVEAALATTGEERAAIERAAEKAPDGTVGASLLERLRRRQAENKSTYADEPMFSRSSKKAKEAWDTEKAQRVVDALVGKGKTQVDVRIGLTDDAGNPVAGMAISKDGITHIALNALNDVQGTTHHEAWHAVENVLKGMGEHGAKVLKDVEAYVKNLSTQRWLHEQYAGDEGALSQMENPRERAAFLFQKLMEGVNAPKIERTKLQPIIDFVRKVLGYVGLGTSRSDERAQNFMDYVSEGNFARDADNVHSVRAALGEKNGDRIIDTVARTTKPVLEGLQKVIGHTSTRVRNLNVPAYNEIMDIMGGVSGKGGMHMEREMYFNRFSHQFGEFFKGMSEAEQQAAVDTPAFKKLINGVYDYMRDEGVPEALYKNLGNRLNTFDVANIDRNFDAFVHDLITHGGLDNTADARKIASDIINEGYYVGDKQRLFAGAPKIEQKWRGKSPIEQSMRLANIASKLGSRTRYLGAKKEYTRADGSKYWQEERLHDLLESGDKMADAEGRQMIRDAIDAYDGNYGSKLSRPMQKLVGGLMFAQNVHALPLMVFSQLLEPLQIGMRKNDIAGSVGTLFRGIASLPRTFDMFDKNVIPSDWEKLANEIGTAPNRIVTSAMAEMMNGTTAGGFIGKMNDRFFRYNFMEQWNRSMHVEATRHAVQFILEHAANAREGKGAIDTHRGNGAKTLRSDRFLSELGLTHDMVKTDKGGNIIRNAQIDRAIMQWVDEAMAHPDAGSNALWMNDPRWALISQMKRFTLANAQYVLGRGTKEMWNGNMTPILPAVLAIPWIAAADGLRDAVSGGTGYESKSFADYVMHGAERANLFGRGQFALDAASATTHGTSPFAELAGPTAQMVNDLAIAARAGNFIHKATEYVPGGGLLNAAM